MKHCVRFSCLMVFYAAQILAMEGRKEEFPGNVTVELVARPLSPLTIEIIKQKQETLLAVFQTLLPPNPA